MTLWSSVRSPPPPRNSLVATTNVASGFPLGSVRSSGSRVSRPTSMTLFIPIPPARFTGCSAPGRVGRSPRRYKEGLTGPLAAGYCASSWSGSARTRSAARIEMVDSGGPQADLGDRRHLALVLHARHPSRHPLDQVALQPGGDATVDAPAAVHQREQRPIQVGVGPPELFLIRLAGPQVGRW